MNRETTVGDLLSLLKREIEERQGMLRALEARLGKEPAPRSEPRKGLAAAAVEILRATGRPMHGLGEVVPVLESQGFRVKSKGGFATLLMRTGKVQRTAPGTYVFCSAGDVAPAG